MGTVSSCFWSTHIINSWSPGEHRSEDQIIKRPSNHMRRTILKDFITNFGLPLLKDYHYQLWLKVLSAQFSSVQFSRSVVSRLFATPWIATRQASLSITNSQSLLKPMSIELVMPSRHLILCHPLLLPPTPPSIRVFFNESTLSIRWPK